jgi:hypothetical protein
VLDERVRSSLYQQLTRDFGEQEATAMVEAVAAYHRHELATRDEMERGFAELRAEISGVRVELADVRAEIHEMGQKIVMWMVPTMATMTALSWAAARFAG